MPRWTEQELREAVSAADSLSDVLRRFGLRPAGGNHKLLRGWLERWQIPTEHFTYATAHARYRRGGRPLSEILVADSPYHRGWLKRRLFAEGLKEPACEMCGQGEVWHGARMALILDHVNGEHGDNRLENLRIVCPNCNATLPTHCGKNQPRANPPRPCPQCAQVFAPANRQQRYCSRACWQRERRAPRPATRRVERPPYRELLEEIATSSWSAVGRRHGVSDNAVRKWVAAYEREHAAAGPRSSEEAS